MKRKGIDGRQRSLATERQWLDLICLLASRLLLAGEEATVAPTVHFINIILASWRLGLKAEV